MKKSFVYLAGALAAGMLSPLAAQAASETIGHVSVMQQQVVVRGHVTDTYGEPVVGATVLEKGTRNATITDNKGDFTLKVKAGATVTISYVGYRAQDLAAASTMNVVLEENAESLGEVVILGYGAQTRKQDLSASVGVINNAEELAARPVSSTEAMLQGQIAGVTVQANGGDPTSTPNVIIRGQGSPNGDNVLWVVDGVPGAPIPSMYDIETIAVLKDAASAAIYGAQSGAGGVVLVTTKKAKAGAPSVSYEGVFGARMASTVPAALTAAQRSTSVTTWLSTPATTWHATASAMPTTMTRVRSSIPSTRSTLSTTTALLTSTNGCASPKTSPGVTALPAVPTPPAPKTVPS